MRTLLKIFFNLLLAAVAVLLTLTVLFFFMPGWQQAAVDRALAEDPNGTWQVKGVHLQPTRMTADKVFYLGNGFGVELGPVELIPDPMDSIFSGVLQLRSGKIESLFIDLSQMDLSHLTAGEEGEGLFERAAQDPEFIESRVKLALARLRAQGIRVQIYNLLVEGSILFPDASYVPIIWHILNADNIDGLNVEVEAKSPFI